jgi:hypothetical protein
VAAESFDLTPSEVAWSNGSVLAGATTDANFAGTTVNLTDVHSNGVTFLFVVDKNATTAATLTLKAQESTNGTSWADITGASTAATTTGVYGLVCQPTQNTVRATATVGTTAISYDVAIVVGGYRQTAPANKGGWNTTAAAAN